MAEIVGVHGVKGWVKLKVFGEDPDILLDADSLSDAAGKKSFRIRKLHDHGNILLAEIEGLVDRTAAEKLRGTKIYMPREALPELKEENTFYHADLIGLTAKNTEGAIMGKVIAVANFGAGDLLDIKPEKGASFYIPFTHDIVPAVCLDKKEVTINPPPGLLD